jgi:hypothetical protein
MYENESLRNKIAIIRVQQIAGGSIIKALILPF